MKKTLRTVASACIAASVLTTALGTLSAGAAAYDRVRVVVKNEQFAAADGAAWDGVLIDEWVALGENDSMESVVEKTITAKNYPIKISEYGYISAVNGLDEKANNGNGGWMMTLNDWFTTEASSAYTVENGGLSSGDEIIMQYTNSWGADVGSLYGDLNTSLASLTVDHAVLTEAFSPSVQTYTLLIPGDWVGMHLTPTAYNKNYQVRLYLDKYQPEVNGAEMKKSNDIAVRDGDTLYIGVGDPLWPTMNSWVGIADGTVYTIHVKSRQRGDLNGDGVLSIQDVTVLQRYLAEFEMLDGVQQTYADMDGDHVISISDATAMQCLLAKQEL